MRVLVVGLLVVVALTGCSAGGRGSGSSAPALAPGAVPTDASTGSGVPADNPSAPREDALGRSPDAAVMVLIDALAKRDWTTAYSLYATPTPTAEIAAKDWSEANERYTGLIVRETRVADSESAWVRLTYKLTTTPTGSSSYSVTIDEPGEWWPVHKVGGIWKIGWMPRQ
jgi:hypothetical protein